MKYRVYASNLKATVGGVEYEWAGGLVAMLYSSEARVKRGECRMIGNVLFSAFAVERRCWGSVPVVSWTMSGDSSVGQVRAFKSAMFDCEGGAE